MCIATEELFIYDEMTAKDFLEANGFDHWDIDEFGRLLHSVEYEDAIYERDTMRKEFKSYEASLDAAHGLFNELLSLLDGFLCKCRTKEALTMLEAVKKTLTDSEVF